ncbi:Kinetochore protein Spc24 [Conoideocrella luteorostrata]|uniref:Kinetochore protein Spc24 n=1 Tax=Conoideocrella luteorostrata TaxID=1105319 RepID=A0AAJ0CIQ0_9HYPO|nr:Kinetochore protein Spc24 [Conoideocrella luteorostrata]
MVSSESTSAKAKNNESKRHLLGDSGSDSDSEDGGAQLEKSGFKVNEEYARRFEHNKKREERHKLEEKLKANGKGRQGPSGEDEDENEDGSSSSNETEDEDGFLATEDLDAKISATLQAIRNKDPRLYDKNYKFIELPDEDAIEQKKKEKPVFLRDYQREKLLRGDIAGSDGEDDGPQTYTQEQDALKKSIVSEINATKGEDDSDSSSDDDFLKKKEPVKAAKAKNGVHPSRAPTLKVSELDVENADKDPETYLSNFLAARAWIPEEGGRWKAFESDDGEDNDNADEFEQAYNLRFEDPEKSNEVLKSYARDFAAARSVRREDKSSRQRQRELEREQKEEEKRQKREDKARLRKLKLDETQEKLQKLKQAAGAVGKELTEAEWMAFLNDAWDDDKWEEEMKKRFGDDYYAIQDDVLVSDDEDDEGNSEKTAKNKKKHTKKPKWEDDIDIKDLVPDFEDEPQATPAADEEDNNAATAAAAAADDDDDTPPSKKRKTSDHKRARLESQKKARQERTKLEALVDSKLELTNHHLLQSNKSGMGGFRYRETSPQSFGMTARDILLAPSDKALNEFFGLKKLASFRDPEKKRRDKKTLGKKARLREWRRGTFGRDFEREGPTYGFEALMDGEEDALMQDAPSEAAHDADGNVVGGVGGRKKKRKRSKSSKGKGAAEVQVQ